jgi:uncharacterized protein YjdB
MPFRRLGALGGLAACMLLGGCLSWFMPPLKTSIVALEVSAPTSMPVGVQRQLVATGTFNDGAAHDVTKTVRWASSDPSVATVTDGGMVSTVGPGAATIIATDPETAIAGSAILTVTPAALVSIAVTPSAAAVAAGTSARLTATGIYGDGTTQDLTDTVVWSSSDDTIAAFQGGADGSGVARAEAPGTVTVIALHAATNISGSATLTVTPAQLVSIAVTPPTASAPVGVPSAFTATGTYTDGTTQDLTASVAWSSSDPSIASVAAVGGSSGRVTGTSPGTVTIQAVDPGTQVAGSADLTVTPAVLVSLSLTPAAPSVPLGTSRQLAAIGTFTDGTTNDVTELVTWSSASAGIASVTNAAGSRGLAKALAIGSTIIRATDPSTNTAGSTTLTVTPASLVSIAVTPATPSVPVGGTQQLIAMGSYTDGTQQDLTATVTWTSSDPATAEVSNAAGSVGLVTGIAPGTAAVEGRDPGSGTSASATVTVTALP